MLTEEWHVIEEAQNYVVSDWGRVRRSNQTQYAPGRFVRIRTSFYHRRKYVELIVDSKVKRLYIDDLVNRYW